MSPRPCSKDAIPCDSGTKAGLLIVCLWYVKSIEIDDELLETFIIAISHCFDFPVCD